jgi:hypothetical protein
MITAHSQIFCLICGHCLTTQEQYAGNRCTDPGHWQAAGLLGPRDFYSLARLVAGIRAELVRRPEKPEALSA